MSTSKSSQPSLIFCDELGADEIARRPLRLLCALSPTAMTSTRTDFPVPAGSTTVPRTT